MQSRAADLIAGGVVARWDAFPLAWQGGGAREVPPPTLFAGIAPHRNAMKTRRAHAGPFLKRSTTGRAGQPARLNNMKDALA